MTGRDRGLDVESRELFAGARSVQARERLGRERAVPARAVLLLNQQQASIVGQAGRDARRVKAQQGPQRKRARDRSALILSEPANEAQSFVAKAGIERGIVIGRVVA